MHLSTSAMQSTSTLSLAPRRGRNMARFPLIVALLVMVMVALLAQPATAFDFFQTFFGGQHQEHGHQRDSSDDRGRSASKASECSEYICPIPSPSPSSSKICVVDPRDCPCPRPALETKCQVGDWYTCVPNSIVPSIDGCKAYLSKLNAPAAFGSADASDKRPEL